MADKKEIKRRIKSVKNIGQITKALQMVSAVKMRKAQAALLSSNDYFQMMENIFSTLLLDIGKDDIAEVFTRNKKGNNKNIALIVVSPSKGFAGALLSNLTKKTIEFIEKRTAHHPYENSEFIIFKELEEDIKELNNEEEEKIDISLVTVEKKSRDFAVKLSKNVIADFPRLSVPPTFEDVIPMSEIMLKGFNGGEFDEVYVVYTHFLNTFSQKAVVKKILPFDLESKYKQIQETKLNLPWFSYSMDKIELFKVFYPIFIETVLYHSVLDAVAAEHSARMIAMKNATDNATDLRKQLTLEYNQKRQAAITQEIAEITSAAETV